jgi:hypothetical protein
MAILWAGNGIECFNTLGAGGLTYTTSGSSFDSNYVSDALFVGSSVNDIFTPLTTTVTECWYHCDFMILGSNYIRTWMTLCDDTDTDRVTFETRGTGSTLQVGYWNGSSFTYLTSYALTTSTRYVFDLHVKIHGSEGKVEFFINGTSVGSFTGNTSSLGATLKGFKLKGLNISSYLTVSQFIVEDGTRSTGTIGLKLAAHPASGNAVTNTGWTGYNSYGNTSDLNDSTTINTSTAGNIVTFPLKDLPTVAADWNILDVWQGIRAQSGLVSPTNIQPAIRSNGANVAAPNLPGLSATVPIGQCYQWGSINPVTGVTWTVADINALEAGVKAVA